MKFYATLITLALCSQAVIACTHMESKCSSEDDRTIVRCVNDDWVKTKCGVETVCREKDHTGPFCDYADDHEEWDHDGDWEDHHDEHNDWEDDHHDDEHDDWHNDEDWEDDHENNHGHDDEHEDWEDHHEDSHDH
ncbi:hypothetical protein K7432_008818 [Basidiobolus ranarum]|uniref:Uncharacterized protein n=1 Tax=Basidiobolus ranarum TaxID=34480 RepID=A0ABR2VY13_9FUNG